MYHRNPWAVSSSDYDVLFMIDSIQLRNHIVERLGKLVSYVYATIATVVVLFGIKTVTKSFVFSVLLPSIHILEYKISKLLLV